jgi:RecA-family ATPase
MGVEIEKATGHTLLDWQIAGYWKPNLEDAALERLNASFGLQDGSLPEEIAADYDREYHRLLDEQARRRAQTAIRRQLQKRDRKKMTADEIIASIEDSNVVSFDEARAKKVAAEPFEAISAESLRKRPIREIAWIAPDWIVANAVNGLFGDGGTGKDYTLFQLAHAVAYDRRWFGMEVAGGKVLYFNVEDNLDVLRWRQAKIEEHLKIESGGDRLKIVPCFGKPTLLAYDRKGIVVPTPLFDEVRKLIDSFKPALTIVGNRVNIFSVGQNDDAQARQCVGLLNSLVLAFDTTVIMPGHASKTGLQEGGDGSSGSVQWSNALRHRLWLRAPTKKEIDEGDHSKDDRILQVMKSNWGPSGSALTMHWQDGVFVAENENRPVIGNVGLKQQQDEDYARAEDEFMRLLDKAELQRHNLSASPTSNNNAPKLFSADSECRPEFKGKGGRKKLAAAMDRLFEKKAIEIAQYGYPSDRTYRLARVKGWQPPQRPKPSGIRF